jgi:hypothetical protein
VPPLLYVDADVVFRENPVELLRLAREGTDFAIYNRLADPCTDGYLPIPGARDLYRFAVAVDQYDPLQLVCSGAVQFYNDSAAARGLLASWLDTVTRWPAVADDESLDYAYNFLIHRSGIRTAWLGKEYLRYPWWIYVRPVIDHPDPVTPHGMRGFGATTGVERFRPCGALPPQGPFPRDCTIDVERKLALRMSERGLQPFARVSIPLWLPVRQVQE